MGVPLGQVLREMEGDGSVVGGNGMGGEETGLVASRKGVKKTKGSIGGKGIK